MIVRPIKDFPDYFVSDTGNIYSLKGKNKCQEKLLKPVLTKSGYMNISLCKDGKVYNKRIHRLVIEAFIPNLDNKPQINHIDGNKQNNNINNLEWCSASENIIHSYNVLKRKAPCAMLGRFGKESPFHKLVLQVQNNIIVGKYYGLHEANRKTGISFQNIYKCCNGKRNTAGGYQWRYKEKGEQDEIQKNEVSQG